jgi:Aminotransferase class-V
LEAKSQMVLNREVPSAPSARFPVETVRVAFPALTRAKQFVFFDNAAGAQVPQVVLDAVNHHLLECNVQRGGRYAKSREVDDAILRARQSVADLVNAYDASEIAFGMNATSFIRLVSLAIGQTLGKRREIVVTDLDHEANVATWLALEQLGAKILWWKVREDGNLHVDDFECARFNRGCRGRSQGSARSGRRSVPRLCSLWPTWIDRRAGLRLRLSRMLGLQDLRAAHGIPLGSPRTAPTTPNLP